MRAHADARAALRRGARRPPGGRPQGQHYRRRERVPVRRVLAGGARRGSAPGGGRLCRPERVAQASAGSDGPAVRLAPLRGAVLRAVRPRNGGAVGGAFQLSGNAMEFVLGLHSHLPYVLNHGRWPHGSDWLCEAALDTYLPLLERLEELATEGTPAPVTIGFTPVLANQLASPTFVKEMAAFFAQRLAACDEAPASLATTGDQALLPLVEFWRSRLTRLEALFRKIDRDLVSAFRRLQEQGRLEIIGSAATHGYLPLLARDESIRLQLAVGREEHRRLFGVAPKGCWLPECAYRPGKKGRRGIEQHLADAGFRYFFTDAHLARAGSPLGAYGDIPLGAERFDAERHDDPAKPGRRTAAARSPYQAYRVSRAARGGVAALVRDPRSSMQIWSRHQGYPGDEWYLEFHKIRWPGGLKLWRVSGANVDLGAKRPYEPAAAHERAVGHAAHFVHLLQSLARDEAAVRGGVIVAPFDTE